MTVITRRGILLLIGVLCSTPALAQTPPERPVIVTHGEATLTRAPDRAWISIAAEARDVRAAEARRKGAEAMTSVQSSLKAAGVPAEAVRTTGYSLTPDMEWTDGRGVIKGYIVRNQIEVRVDDLTKLGDILDAANASGRGVSLSIVGPRFDLKNQEAAVHEALKAAVESALGRAQAMAAGANRTLGTITRIEEQNFGPRAPQPFAMAARAQAAEAKVETPITPGEIEVRADVTLTVEIK